MRPMPNFITRVMQTLLAVALFATLSPAFAQTNAIEAINVSPQSGGRIIVRVTLKDPPATPPAGFTVNNPPRIALDFPGTLNAMGRNIQEVSEGDLRRINVVQAGDRTRMVLELSRTVRYDTQIEGRTVLITLAGAGETSTTGTAQTITQT